MGIQEYFRLIRQHLVTLVVTPLLLAAIVFFASGRQEPIYRATSKVLLRPNDPNERVGTGAAGNEIVNADRVVQAQADIARSPSVLEAASAALGTISVPQLEKILTVTPASNSNILRVSVDDPVPSRAADIANGVTLAFIDNRRAAAVKGLETALADLDTRIAQVQKEIAAFSDGSRDATRTAEESTAKAQYQSLSDRRLQLSIDRDLKRGEAEFISSARVPISAISPRPFRNAVLAGIIGLLAASGFVLLRDRLDTRLRDREDAEDASGLATLAEIPVDRLAVTGEPRVAAQEEPNGIVAEAIRSLRVSLRFLGLEQPVRVILVTSAAPGDGKSTVSVNLAHSYAEAGERTLLVSADLRRPQVEHLASVDSQSGLVELLDEMAAAKLQRPAVTARATKPRLERAMGVAKIANYCHEDAPNLWLLPAGRHIANPVEILGSAVAKEFFARAAEEFEVVIVDSPPLLAVADAVVLSQFVDGVLVVTSVRKTPFDALARAIEVLRSGQPRILGLVLNRVSLQGTYGYGYGYSTDRADDGESAPSVRGRARTLLTSVRRTRNSRAA